MPHAALTEKRAWSARQVRRLVTGAAADGLVREQPGERIELTASGWEQAIQVARNQRFWEAFLAAYPDQAGSVANLGSDSAADFLPQPIVRELTSQLEAAGRWPRAEAAA